MSIRNHPDYDLLDTVCDVAMSYSYTENERFADLVDSIEGYDNRKAFLIEFAYWVNDAYDNLYEAGWRSEVAFDCVILPSVMNTFANQVAHERFLHDKLEGFDFENAIKPFMYQENDNG